MSAFLARRLLLGLGVLAAVSFGTFAVMATRFSSACASKYSPAGVAFPPLAGSIGTAARLYAHWLAGVPSGRSFSVVCGTTTSQSLSSAFIHTGALLLTTGLLVVVGSLAAGISAATDAGSLRDVGLRGLAYAAWAVPSFVLALVLQTVIEWAGSSHGFHLLATRGWPGSCLPTPGLAHPICAAGPKGLDFLVQLLRHLVAPAVSLAVAFVGIHSRYVRSSLVTALAAPYTTTARAKGLPERTIVVRHALRNALAPFTSALLLDFGAIFGAALAVDWVFQLGGVGSLLIDEIGGSGSGDGPRFLDPYAIETLLAAAAALVVFASVTSEMVVLWLDPRTRRAT